MLRMTSSTPSLTAANGAGVLRQGAAAAGAAAEVARGNPNHQRPLPPPPVPPRPSKSVVAEALARTRGGRAEPRVEPNVVVVPVQAVIPTRRAPPPPSHPPAPTHPRGRPPPLPDQPPVASVNGTSGAGPGGRSRSTGRTRRLKDTPAPALPPWALEQAVKAAAPVAPVGKASREADGGGRLRSPSKPLVLSPAPARRASPASPAPSPKLRSSSKDSKGSPSPTVLVIDTNAELSSLDSGKASDGDSCGSLSSRGSQGAADLGVQLRRRSRILQSDWFEVEGDGKEVRYSSCQITIEDPAPAPPVPSSGPCNGVTVVVGSGLGSAASSPASSPIGSPSAAAAAHPCGPLGSDCRNANASLKRLVMASLQGLPPLPKSLSGANLLEGSGLLFTPAEMAAVTGMPPPPPAPAPSGGGSGAPSPGSGSGSGLSHSGSFRHHSSGSLSSRPTPPRGTTPPSGPSGSRNGSPLQCMSVPPPPPPRTARQAGPGRATNLDAQLAVLRKEMVSACVRVCVCV
ncbi:Titin [Frankliniella fusca]|uniref:Titin n=1 Tax=Frankliniella fusca TaxID=407009 RepID=A0AAE1H9G7_9NEOP|nr:Titin [Frankliniella fusca]